MVLLLVLILCIVLYKTGSMNKLLTACELSDSPEYIEELNELAEPEEGRQKWETEAAYILKRQGMDPDTVQYMGDEMLMNIIREYLDI